ncbi:hypothetical protein [Sphaerimonospora mesophila]|uniref:hypothetical protein n=1 Tax=Sphaerimonospora mesophila TaxID=37483 RepID=UPI000A989C0D
MMRFVRRVLAPLTAPISRRVRSRIDARYVTKADHRRDIKDALWEVQMLRREVVSLRNEVDRLRKTAKASAAPAPARDPRVAEAHRLATETADALDKVLQNEVRVWQAIDDLSARVPVAEQVRHIEHAEHVG